MGERNTQRPGRPSNEIAGLFRYMDTSSNDNPLGNKGTRQMPRTFKWSQTSRDIVMANLHVNGRQLSEMLSRLVETSGNPRDACLRFARKLGLRGGRPYRRWTRKERESLEELLDGHKIRVAAQKLHRTPKQLYGAMQRLGMTKKVGTDRFSLYELAALIKKRPALIRKWIQNDFLKADNEGTETFPHWLIAHKDVRQFLKKHQAVIQAARIDPYYLNRLQEMVTPRPHTDLLPVRESKKEREAYEEQDREDDHAEKE